ncbi:MazG nucleotide pyrophosphohydrolase domain-containing protein [Okeania sp. KiyG1]|uniref:MazG nucleotide pyrophosphohydrolase domain-containing protein n=1 Tax=Okeania sp. KiyG1 TaxID=2720165 RepID=UPI001920908B|nr:MazG nucleotide pyrophosphohydrolase domain-containing protein [Okeania sp. KiyG1]GGA19699.1 hypothetical protein CYANOKiyG1_34390 [Okeania sp. KiyG1]
MNKYQSNQFQIFDNLHAEKTLLIKRLHWAIALAEETGEVEKEIKKNLIFNSQSDEETVDKLSEELGDVLLCISMIASYYKIDLDFIVETSLDKMQKRFTKTEDSRI